nr:hypothetical protein [Tanacetum cinerariifolium]
MSQGLMIVEGGVKVLVEVRLWSQDEAFDKFKVFKTEVLLEQRSLIKRFRTDREMITWILCILSVGIIHEIVAPCSSQQNGVSERKNMILKEMVTSMLPYSGLSQRVWDCRAVLRLFDPKLKTLGERGIECIFVGYAEHSKAYLYAAGYVGEECVALLLFNGKEVDIGLGGGCDKPLRPEDMLLYSWDEGLDVCVDLTGSSPLTQTEMVDFVPGHAVIDATHRKQVKYEAKCANIGYGFLPFSFSSLRELEKDAVNLLKRIRKFFMAQDIGARAAVHIFNRISFAIAKGVGAQLTMNGKTYRYVLCYRLGVPLFSVSKPCSACSKVFTGDIYGDHAVSCAGIIGIKHRHNMVRDTLVDICFRPGISAGLDVCVDLTRCSPLTQTGLTDFLAGRAVVDAAHRKCVKYEAKCADIGYGFLPFSFSSFGELENDAVNLLKRIRKFSVTQDIRARAAVYIFNRISFVIAKGYNFKSKRGKYMDTCAAIGYGFLPFSFSSLRELEAYAVILLKRIRKFLITQDMEHAQLFLFLIGLVLPLLKEWELR